MRKAPLGCMTLPFPSPLSEHTGLFMRDAQGSPEMSKVEGHILRLGTEKL